MDVCHLNDTAWKMEFMMIVFEPKIDFFFSETKFLKYTLKLIHVNFLVRKLSPPSPFLHFFLLSPLSSYCCGA